MKRRKIGELAGLVKPLRNIPKKFSVKSSISIVELDGGVVLDCRKFKNKLCYINHSCKPNCFMRIFKNNVEIYSLRPIKAGEELTLNYGFTHHEGTLKCKCGNANCIGYI